MTEAEIEQQELNAFIERAGFRWGWDNLESWARDMARQAVKEQAQLRAQGQEPSHYLYGFREYSGATYWSLSSAPRNGCRPHITKPVFDAPPVPQGMVLVPVKPTEEMLTALRKAYNTARDCFYDGIEGVAANPPLQAYNAMLSVAQGEKK